MTATLTNGAPDVDRTHRISSIDFAVANPDRVTVNACDDHEWVVYRGLRRLQFFSTFAEAIRFADKVARSNVVQFPIRDTPEVAA